MTGRADPPAVDLDDARWFPIDLDVGRGVFHLLRVDRALLADAAFLDNRLPVDWTQATLVPAAAVPAPRTAPGWLWHTSFCGSTLLARMLDVDPHAVVLREPLVLRRLSDARHGNKPWREFIPATNSLLGRDWNGAKAVVKPTHAALNVASEVMAADPGSRAILLSSSLEDFVVSHLKKQPETLQRIPLLAERALSASGFHQRLAPAALQPPTLLAAATLQWAAQREVMADLQQALRDRVLAVDWAELQQEPVAQAQRCAAWLELPVAPAMLERHVLRVAGAHAKVPGRPYNAETRRAESRALALQYRSEVHDALAWASRHVLPKMQAAAIALRG